MGVLHSNLVSSSPQQYWQQLHILFTSAVQSAATVDMLRLQIWSKLPVSSPPPSPIWTGPNNKILETIESSWRGKKVLGRGSDMESTVLDCKFKKRVLDAENIHRLHGFPFHNICGTTHTVFFLP